MDKIKIDKNYSCLTPDTNCSMLMEHLSGTSRIPCNIISCTCSYCDSPHNIYDRAQHVSKHIGNGYREHSLLTFVNSTSTLQSANVYCP